MLEAFERYRYGQAVPVLEWAGSDPSEEEKYFTGFRLFAKSIDDVGALQGWLETQGVEVITQLDEIESVQKMDQTLSTVYWVIALIGIVGFSTSLGANLWANVERKRKELSIIRVIGFSTFQVICFPVVQSLFTVLFGWLLAVGVYHGVSFWINQIMNSQLEAGTQVCILLPQHYLISLLATVVISILAATFAGIKAAYIEPAEGMREI
jgi:putative ABC transport system permease protein